MSKHTRRRASLRSAASTAFESAMPSPMADFSVMPYTRWLDATSVVRSGVTNPRTTARPASINSAAMTTSTSPGTGISAKIGSARPIEGGGHISR